MAAKRPGHCDVAGPVRKKKKAYCHFKSAWKSQEFTVTVGGVEETVSGKILSGVEGADNAKCTECGVAFSVRHGGANDVIKHFSTQNHWQAVSSKASTSNLANFGLEQSEAVAKSARKKRNEQQLQVQWAEHYLYNL